MARFFVGQRVRKVASTRHPNEAIPMGATGVIVEVDVLGPTRRWDCYVSYDAGHGYAYGLFCCLEPILPDGHRTGDFTNVHDLLESLSKEFA